MKTISENKLLGRIYGTRGWEERRRMKRKRKNCKMRFIICTHFI
jgi:hypothetical protein